MTASPPRPQQRPPALNSSPSTPVSNPTSCNISIIFKEVDTWSSSPPSQSSLLVTAVPYSPVASSCGSTLVEIAIALAISDT
ncbi:hypothetical protein PIB30_005847 [Stylosanthes scabra]|uniref:Uncharacterized protein n=1 Tax=Stylosanthes scabra TaxID=79078 RepID=A0ABU6Z175_9FABA|nr:hypothetical protein [Stylosanthes scabra]